MDFLRIDDADMERGVNSQFRPWSRRAWAGVLTVLCASSLVFCPKEFRQLNGLGEQVPMFVPYNPIQMVNAKVFVEVMAVICLVVGAAFSCVVKHLKGDKWKRLVTGARGVRLGVSLLVLPFIPLFFFPHLFSTNIPNWIFICEFILVVVIIIACLVRSCLVCCCRRQQSDQQSDQQSTDRRRQQSGSHKCWWYMGGFATGGLVMSVLAFVVYFGFFKPQ